MAEVQSWLGDACFQRGVTVLKDKAQSVGYSSFKQFNTSEGGDRRLIMTWTGMSIYHTGFLFSYEVTNLGFPCVSSLVLQTFFYVLSSVL